MAEGRDRADDLSALIDAVYDAALDETLWPVLAARIAQAFASTSTGMAVQSQMPARRRVELLGFTANFDAAAIEDYRTHYWQRDIWAERGAKAGLGRVLASKDIISDAEFERTEYHFDWCRARDIYYVVGSVFPISGDEIGILGIHRPKGGIPYDENDKARVGLFLPHLRRALQIRRRLTEPAIQRQAALEALERSATAMLVLGREGQLVYANRPADALLRAGDAIRAVGDRVVARDRAGAQRLSRLVREAADTAAGQAAAAGGGALSLPRGDRLPLTLLVAPFRPARDGFGGAAPAAILFIRDPEAPSPATAALRDMFGLTPAEAGIAGALADGKALDDIACIRRISLNTARSHLKSVLAKTGTDRQAALVALVLRSVATLASK